MSIPASTVILAVFLAFTVFLTLNPNLTGGVEESRIAMDVDLSDGWMTADGTPVRLDSLNDLPDLSMVGVTITRTLPHPIEPGAELNYITKNVEVHQYYDDEEVYVHGGHHEERDAAYATRFNFTPLSSANAGETVTLFIKAAHAGNASQILNMRISGTAAYIQRYVRAHALAFSMSVAIIFGGLAILLLSLVLRSARETELDLVSLSTLAILLGTWSATQTLIPQLVTGLYSILRALEYLTLLFAPYSGICFAISLVDPPQPQRYKHVALAALTAAVSYTLATVTLTHGNMHDSLSATHLFIAFSICLIASMIVRSLRSRGESLRESFDHVSHTMLASFFLLAFCVVADLFTYIVTAHGSTDPAFFSRLGLLVFTCVMGADAVQDSIEFVKKADQAEMIEQLAYTDSLTGIGNHTAWQRLVSDVAQTLENGLMEDAMVCQFDLNFLKRVNDTQGHAAGDAYLRLAAEVLTRSFGTEGTCYRTGSDEFSGMIVGSDLEERLQRCIELFDVSIEEQKDGEMPVSIALGWATVSEVEEHTVSAAQQLADERMYENKRLMKAERLD